ncbi:hypothetical protein ACS0TY_030656 [Phlomoides rotata]
MMDIRAARMVHVADSLLISRGLLLSTNHVHQRTEKFNKLAEITNSTLSRIGEESAASLKVLESHYYSSTLRTSVPHEP